VQLLPAVRLLLLERLVVVSRSVLALLLLALLTACGRDKEQPAATSSLAGSIASPEVMIPKREIDKNLAKVQKIVRNVTLTCIDNDCNPSVGILSIVNKVDEGWMPGQCTASLIGPDLVVTNGHCIPKDLAQSGSDCSGRLFISFAEDSAHPEYDKQIGCSQILLRHKDAGLDGADYAYLKLERASNRPALRQSRDGFDHGKTYHLHKVDPLLPSVSKGIAGRFEKVPCRALQDTDFFDSPLNKQSRTQLLADCQVIGGNSGSPVIADDGTVRGVIYAFLEKDKVYNLLSKNGSTIPEQWEIADLNVASNFACLNDASDPTGQALPAACAGYAERVKAMKQQADASKLKASARKIIRSNQGERAYVPAFEWTLQFHSTPSSGEVAYGYPECAVRGKVKGLLGQKTKYSRPQFYVAANYDRYLYASNRKLVWADFSRSVEVLGIVRNGGNAYNVEIKNPKNGKTDFKATLPGCI